MNKSTRRQETRIVLAISLPLMAAYVAEMGMMITDMIIVGRLGSKELAAVGLTADWFYVLLLLGMGVVSIVGVLAAQNFGAGNTKGVTDAVEQGVIAATIMSIPVMLAVWYLGPALRFANQDPEVVGLITDYSRPMTWGVLPALWFVVLRNFITALAKSSAIMIITAGALLLNLLLNYTLVFGKFGFPALGVVGAGYGTTIVNWLMFLFLAVHVATSANFADHRFAILPKRVKFETLREIFVLGLPVTVTQMLNGAMFTVAAILVGMISADILAAQMIVYSVIYFALSASVGLGDAARVRVAYGVGTRSVDASRQSAYISFALAGATILIASGVLWLFPEVLVGIFLNISDVENASVLMIAIGLSVYGGWFMLFDGVLIVAANAIRGLRDTRSPLWISIAGYWGIGLGIGTWLCFSLGYGVKGLWWGLILGALFANILMFWRFRNRLGHAERQLNLEEGVIRYSPGAREDAG
jgi:MATE family multidrug resistance protein